MGDNLLDDLLDDILIDTGAGTEHDDLLDHLLGDDKDGNAAIPTLQETLNRRSHHSSNGDNTAAHDDNDDDINETGHDGDNISLPTETESGIDSTPDSPLEDLSASTEEEITFGPDETIVPANPTLRTEPWNAPTPPSTPWKTTDSKHRLRRRAPEDVTLAQSDAFLRRGLRSGNDTTVRGKHPTGKIKIPRAEQTRKVTVPLTPHFHGRSVAQPVGRNASRNQATWAQSSRVFSEGLRDGKDNVPTAAKDHDPNHNRLTVPVGPKFHGTPHEIHKPPKFHEDLTMAESVASFGRGLRRSTGTSSPKAKHRGVTVPVEPKFHSTTHYTRNRPKSAEEQEAELMEYYKANPIKANPLPSYLATSGGNARPHHRSKQVDAASYVQKEELDALECRKQFKARPMPHFPEEALLSKTHERRPLTQTEPFRFRVARLDSPTRKTNAAPTSPDRSVDDNVAVAFKARPVPKSTYVSPPRKTKTPRPCVPNLTPQVLTHPCSYDPARDASRHMQADNRVRQQAQAKQSRQRDQHWQDMQHAMQSVNMGKSTPTIKPFQLESVTRHEAYQAELAIKRAQEQRELYERAQFKARPVGFTKQA